MSKTQVGNASYQTESKSYIEQRQLKKSAGWKLLWAMGVGAVISGDYFGWNFGLDAGGFGGLLIAVIFIAIMYVCMVLSIAELSTAMPHAAARSVQRPSGPLASSMFLPWRAMT